MLPRWSVALGCPRNHCPGQRKTDPRAHQQTLPGEPRSCSPSRPPGAQTLLLRVRGAGVWPGLRPGGARQAALSQHRVGGGRRPPDGRPGRVPTESCRAGATPAPDLRTRVRPGSEWTPPWPDLSLGPAVGSVGRGDRGLREAPGRDRRCGPADGPGPTPRVPARPWVWVPFRAGWSASPGTTARWPCPAPELGGRQVAADSRRGLSEPRLPRRPLLEAGLPCPPCHSQPRPGSEGPPGELGVFALPCESLSKGRPWGPRLLASCFLLASPSSHRPAPSPHTCPSPPPPQA